MNVETIDDGEGTLTYLDVCFQLLEFRKAMTSDSSGDQFDPEEV